MTASGSTHDWTARLPAVADILGVLDLWTGSALRPVRTDIRIEPAWRRLALPGAFIAIAVVAAMLLVDEAAYRVAIRLPTSIINPFNEFTDFGRSAWCLVPLGVLYLATVVIAAAPVGRFTYAVLAAFAVRFGFLFVAIGAPSLVVTIVKRMIGRVRPSELGPFAYEPFGWRAVYASMPSGHTTTAFAALVAIGLVVPRARVPLWVFAVLIGLSRVIVASHFPSDVIAGAACGAFGAIVVRDWFAARRLAFVIGSDGAVRPLPGPSFGRVKKLARALFGQ